MIFRYKTVAMAVVLLLAFAALDLRSGRHLARVFGQNAGATAANVNGQRISNADSEPGNWLTHGRTYSETRFSPLRQIDDRSASPGLSTSTPTVDKKQRLSWSMA